MQPQRHKIPVGPFVYCLNLWILWIQSVTMHSFILNITIHKIHFNATNSYPPIIWIMLNFYKFDLPRGRSKRGWTEWRTSVGICLRRKSGLSIKGRTKRSMLWKVRTASLGILKEWTSRRYRGWKWWRISPRKSWYGKVTKWQSGLSTTKIEVSAVEVPTGHDLTAKNRKHRMRDGPFQQEIAKRASTKSWTWSYVAPTFADRECPACRPW